MKSLTLSALIGSHPLGALASFGLLRLVSAIDPLAKLAFVQRDDWIASLESSVVTDEAKLIEVLSHWLKTNDLDEALGWATDVRMERSAYVKALDKAITASPSVRSEFLSSLVADGAVDTQKGLVKPSAFYMVSGQQSFLGGLREILAQARTSPEAIFQEAVFGPWRYRVRSHSLGWDPNTERLHALRSFAPTSEKPSCIAGAVLLAFWALPTMPAMSNEGRPQTIGFARRGRDQYFCWPIFSKPIDAPELTTLLQVGAKGWRCGQGLRSGIEAVFESSKFVFGQGYAVLRPARAIRSRSVVSG
ncbi:type I-G CRISPR-associated protein, Cas3-extension family [Steroidobacter cummioxidans]|uniref:type I-G CRISPR-associated protein, Cas3-extension family n=1 Tax=Steroidobacter cummioxidans TaxID=1803913 RepID=UPI000E313D96|nr:hypothetical protein [Steroidobacter cummioxidans]